MQFMDKVALKHGFVAVSVVLIDHHLWIDRFVAGACLRPVVALQSLQRGAVAPGRLAVALQLVLPGFLLEPLAWCQTWLVRRRMRTFKLPDDPVVIVGHWRSGTTFLHQLMAADLQMATARNSLTVAPQVAVLLKPLLVPLLQRWMTRTRPIDAVPWSAQDSQEDEIGLARLTSDTNMAGVAFPQDYLHHFRRCVLATTPEFERRLLQFARLTWLHDGAGKTRLLIKNSAHTARVPQLLKMFPKARFVLLKREPIASIRSLVQVKQTLAHLVGLQAPLDEVTQVEETVVAHCALLEAFERFRPLIPAGQLVEVPYEDLIADPLAATERIYRELQLPDWDVAQPAIAERAAMAREYRAQPVRLSPEAEACLQALMRPAGEMAATSRTPPGRQH